MDMGMVVQITGPSLKNTDHADVSSDKSFIHLQFLNGFSRSFEEDVIDPFLVASGNRSDLFGQRDRDHEVRQRQEQISLLF